MVTNTCTMLSLAIDTGGAQNMRRGSAVSINGLFMGEIVVALLIVLVGIVAAAASAQDAGGEGGVNLQASDCSQI